MTTNETSFFRDGRPFDALRDTVLPDVIERRSRNRSLNIWCAACSSGQEPYSIAMLLREDFPQLNDWNVRILGTDLSQEMVDRCKQGTYSQFEINRGLPARYLPRHFERAGASWSVMAATRRGLDFRTMNLIDPWPALPAMDIVFIRNVLIYFDAATKRNLLERAHRALAPEGYLFLGGAETTINLHDGFERLPITLAGCYRKLDPALVRA
ncbi:MAG: protein-glutamate O-methyltransferase CheR [Acidimicrobiia bacterium]